MEKIKTLPVNGQFEAVVILEEKYLQDEVEILIAQMDSNHQDRAARRIGPFLITVQPRYARD